MNDHNLKPPIKKGEVRNKRGRPKDPPELHMIKKMTKPELELLMNQLLIMNKDQLKFMKDHGNGIEMAMAAIILNAVDRGDQWRLQFFIERLFGKVSDKLEIDDKSGIADKLNRFKSKTKPQGENK